MSATCIATVRRGALALLLAAGLLAAPCAWAVEDKAPSSSAEVPERSASSSVPEQKPGAASEPEVANDPFADAAKVDLEDGIYLIEVFMEGGSGKASVASPAEYEVFDGKGVATLVWSSPNYDYMLVNGKKYLPTTTSPTSVFVVPVTAYDEPVDMVGDTTAMSAPHEVDYQLTFDSASVAPFDQSVLDAAIAGEDVEAGDAAADTGGLTLPWKIFIVCAAISAVLIGILVGVIRGYRNR